MTRPAGLLVVVALALVACDPPNPYPADTFPEYVVVNRCGYAVQVTGLDETRVLQADETAT